MNLSKNLKTINEIAKQYGMANEQLIEYLRRNDLIVFDAEDKIDLSKKHVKSILEKLEIKEKVNHNNLTGITRFKVKGLFGKYNFDIKFNNDVSIWVSENGVGKTMLLKLFIALLKNDYKYLWGVKFQTISLEIDGKVIVFDKTQFQDEFNQKYLINKSNDLYLKLIRRLSPEDMRYLNRVIRKQRYFDEDILNFIESKVYLEPSDYNDECVALVRTLKNNQRKMMTTSQSNISYNKEIVFYPTYRRVEEAYNRIFNDETKKYERRDLSQKNMEFGMDDVQYTIDKLLNKQKMEAHFSYSKVNAAILGDLLDGKVEDFKGFEKVIDINKLNIITKRLGYKDLNNKDLEKKLEDNKNEGNSTFLKYYLYKLVEIYDSQKQIDEKLSTFAKVCSKYLYKKEMKYDKFLLTLNIYDDINEKIEFEMLSSGEKQLISIFSKVYLECVSPCIFIIDEPELSLSIEWQKNFLIDIYASGKVDLLIATTHSPFIFDNDFFDYAVAINVGD